METKEHGHQFDHERPAFPIAVDVNGKSMMIEPGITMLDYFAAATLGDLMSLEFPDQVARTAYDVAEAMMRERENRLLAEEPA